MKRQAYYLNIRNYLLFCPRLRRGSLVQQELFTLMSSSTTGVPSVTGTTYSSFLVYDGGPLCNRNYLLFCPRLRRWSLEQQELLTLLSSSMTRVPSVTGTTYSSVLVYDGGPQCIRNYLLFCPRLRRGSLEQQELLTLLSSSTMGVRSIAGTTYSSVLVYDGGPQCSRNYLLFCPRLRRESLVQQELFTLLSSSMKRVPSVTGTTYSSVLVYDGDPQCSRNYLLFCPRLRWGSLVQQKLFTLMSSSTTGVPSVTETTYSSFLVYDGGPQCNRNYLLFCPRLRRGSLEQQELLTLLSSSMTRVPSVTGTTYSSVLVYDGGPQCSRNYLLFCPRLRRGFQVYQELLTLLSSSMTGVPSVAGTTYSSVLVYDEGSKCIRNYLLFCPRLRRGSLVYQELLTLLSSSTTRVPSVSGTTYSSVLVYDGGPQCIRNYLLFCPRLRRDRQCSRNYLLFCLRLRRESLVQQELLTLLSSSTTGVPSVAGTTYSSVFVYDGIPSVAGTTYSSVLVYDGGPQSSRNYLLFCPRLRRGPQCIRNYLLFFPRLRRGSLVQQELLTLLSSSTTGVPSVAGTTYSSVLVYDGDPSASGTTYSSVLVYDGNPQCSRNDLLFCPRLRRGSLVQQELLTLLSSSTTGVPSVVGTTYSSVLVYDGGPQSSRNYLLFCPRLRRGPQCIRNYLLFFPRLRRGSLGQQELLTLLSSSTTRVPSVAGTIYSSVLFYDGSHQCSRNYLHFCPRLRWRSLVQQELYTLLSSSTTGALVQQELLTLLSLSTTGVQSVAGTTYSSVLVCDEGPQCSRNYLLFCPRLRRGSLVQQELLTLLSSSTTRVPSVARTTYSSVLVNDGGPQCSRNYLLFCPRLRRGSLVQQDILTLLSSSMTGVPSVAGTTYSSVLVYDGGSQCSRNYLLFCPRIRWGSLVQQERLTLLSSSTTGVPSVAGTTYSSVLVYHEGPQCSNNYLLLCPRQ